VPIIIYFLLFLSQPPPHPTLSSVSVIKIHKIGSREKKGYVFEKNPVTMRRMVINLALSKESKERWKIQDVLFV